MTELPKALSGTDPGPATVLSHPPTYSGEASCSAKDKPLLFPDNIQFWYETVRAFGAAGYGGREFGEVLATTARIRSGNFDSWYDEWDSTAAKVAREGAEQLARGHRISARDSFLRASTYHRASEFFLHGNPGDPRIANAYRKSIECYKACARLFEPPIEPVEIPYEHTTLPGYFHRVDDSDRRRPLLIIHSGFDGSAEEVHVDGSRCRRAWLQRIGRRWPRTVRQFGPLHREGLTFRPDWEKVVTQVVDFALTLPVVDPGRIALMGISLGGELGPRAAAFEKRIAALIANDGVYNYGAANLAHVPADLRAAVVEMLTAKEAPHLDKMIEASMSASPTAAWAITHGMHAMGAPTPRAYLAAAQAFNLRNGIAEAISCPTVSADQQEAHKKVVQMVLPSEFPEKLKTRGVTATA